jgi:hypothetical protein
MLPALIAAGYAHTFADIARRDDRAPQQSSIPVIVPDWHGIEIRPNHNAIRLPPGSQIDSRGTAKGWTAAQIVLLFGVSVLLTVILLGYRIGVKRSSRGKSSRTRPAARIAPRETA